MKKTRIIGLVLTAIYCFAIGVVNQSLRDSDFSSNPALSIEKAISDFTVKLTFPTSQSEPSVNDNNNLPIPSFKKPISQLLATGHSTEQFYKTAFSQYTNFSLNLLIRNRKTDIIFPFHYFW